MKLCIINRRQCHAIGHLLKCIHHSRLLKLSHVMKKKKLEEKRIKTTHSVHWIDWSVVHAAHEIYFSSIRTHKNNVETNKRKLISLHYRSCFCQYTIKVLEQWHLFVSFFSKNQIVWEAHTHWPKMGGGE